MNEELQKRIEHVGKDMIKHKETGSPDFIYNEGYNQALKDLSGSIRNQLSPSKVFPQTKEGKSAKETLEFAVMVVDSAVQSLMKKG